MNNDYMYMRKKRVLFFNGSVYLPGEGGYKRTMYLVDMMKTAGYQVTLLTTDFNHYQKKVRNIKEFRNNYPEYEHIQFVHRPAYKKNISIKRLISEKEWAYKAIAWFKKHIDEYDVVYTDMPNPNLIIGIAKDCEKHNIKMITDVRDLLPEAFRVKIKNETLYQILTFGMKIKANKAYSCADELIAVSQEYLDRALKFNTKSKDPVVVYLGFTLSKFDHGVSIYSDQIEKGEDEIWVTYAGTLGSSYDIDSILCAAKKIKEIRKERVIFKILGHGPEAERLQNFAKKTQLDNVEFVGFVSYEKMAAYLSKSDMAVNALKKTASQSIINKVADYFAAGIPIINAKTKPEMSNMVDVHQLGINYEPENVDSLVASIINIIENPEKALLYGENARSFALKKFNREVSYQEIVKRIDQI